jgi:hypothetical protein
MEVKGIFIRNIRVELLQTQAKGFDSRHGRLTPAG